MISKGNREMFSLSKSLERPKRRELLVFSIYIFFFTLVYAIMMRARFSVDSYANYYVTDGGIQNLKLGRVANYVLLSILNHLNINIVKWQVVFTVLFVFALAWSAKVLYRQMASYTSNLQPKEKLFLLLAVAIAYTNVSILEWFLFPEMAIFWACTVVTVTGSIYWFFREGHWAKYLISFGLLCMALSFYQAAIGFYVVIGTSAILIKNGMQVTKETVKDYLIYYAIAGVACIITIETLDILVNLGIVPLTERSPSFDISVVFSNILKVLKAQKTIWWDGMTFVPILIGAALLVLLTVLVIELKRAKPIRDMLLILLLLLIAYASVFAPHFLTHTFWMAPRTIYSFFSVVTLLSVLILYSTNDFSRISAVLNSTLIILLVANVMVIQQVTSDQVATNRLDQEQAQQIMQCIEKYEHETGNEVLYISVQPDEHISYSYPGINSTYMDMNLRALSVSWSAVKCLNYYSNGDFVSVKADREEHCSHFQKSDWDQFVPDEQLQFEGSTMYWMIY